MLKYSTMNENDTTSNQQPTPMQRNQVTWQKHRREVRLQIILPLVLGIILVLVLGVLVTLGSNAAVSQGADVALIWLLAPWLPITLIFLAALSAIVYGLASLLKVLPFYTRQVQDFFLLVRDRVSDVTNKLVAPILSYESKKASSRSLWRNLLRK